MGEQVRRESLSHLALRPMRLDDIDQVCEIERECFPTPWTAAAFYNELVNNHFAHYRVVEFEGQIVGYGGMWTIVDEAHITNIAVRARFRGRKIGERLLRKLQQIAISLEMQRMTLEVRMSNTIAQRLYAKMGFYPAGVRPKYYSDNDEDAMIMWAEL